VQRQWNIWLLAVAVRADAIKVVEVVQAAIERLLGFQ